VVLAAGRSPGLATDTERSCAPAPACSSAASGEGGDPHQTHQPLHPLAIDGEPVGPQHRRHPPRAEKRPGHLSAPLHGHQWFFPGYYDCYRYLPLYVFCGRHMFVAKLRRSNIDASAGAVEEVARIVAAPGKLAGLCSLIAGGCKLSGGAN
jgi:hypothetical protein